MSPDKIKAIEADVTPEVVSQLLTPLETLLSESIDANYQGERVLQLFRLQRSDNFYRGIQNSAPMMDPNSGALFWTQFGSSGTPIATPEDMERAYDYNPRLTKGYGDKFTSVLGVRPFYNTTAEAANPKSDTDRRGARQVNLLIEMLHKQWDVTILNHRLAYTIYKSGTPFGYLRPVTDGDKHGYDDIPTLTMTAIQHPNYPDLTVQVPVPGPTIRVARTSVDLEILDGYTVCIPFNVKRLPDSPWLSNECEFDWGMLCDAHPNARAILGEDGLSGGTSGGMGEVASATAATVRAASQSQTGTVRARNTNLRTYRLLWLAASRLQLIKDKAARALALQSFPEGMRIVQIEGQIIALKKQNLTACWSAVSPGMADYLLADGTSWGMFGLEDAMSNLLNIAMEILETGVPDILANQNYVSVQAINDNRWSPNRVIGTLPMSGEDLGNAFREFPTSTFPAEMPEVFTIVKDLIENFLGLLPQVYGQMPQGLTLGQARMMLTQGLMQLSTTGALMTRWWEQNDTNAVRMYCEVANANPVYGGQTIDLDLIRRAQWTIRGNTTMPRSYAERKETLQEIITQNPDMAKAMHVTDPVNFPALADYLDLPDLKNPAADMVEAIQEIVDQLWNGQPQMMAGPDGQPQLQPSIPFDALVFDPAIGVSVSQASLVESFGQQRQATPGYANVRAFLQQAQTEKEKQNQPQPDPPKLTISTPVDRLPAPEGAAVLAKFGIQVPQTPPGQVPDPSPHTASKIMEIGARAEADIQKETHRSVLGAAMTPEQPGATTAPPMGPPNGAPGIPLPNQGAAIGNPMGPVQ